MDSNNEPPYVHHEFLTGNYVDIFTFVKVREVEVKKFYIGTRPEAVARTRSHSSRLVHSESKGAFSPTPRMIAFTVASVAPWASLIIWPKTVALLTFVMAH